MAFKMKNPSMAKMVKAAGDNRAAMKMKMEAAAKMKAESAMKMKSPMEKELVGKQKNLPPELKAKIEAAPSKMKKSAMKMKKSAMEMKKSAMKKEGEATKYTKTKEYKAYLERKKKYNKENPGSDYDAAFKPFEGKKYNEEKIDIMNVDSKKESGDKKPPTKFLGRKKNKKEAKTSRSVTKTSGYGLQPTVTQTSSTKKDGKFVRTTTNTADRPLAKEKHEYLKKAGKFPSAQAESDHAKKNKVYSSTIMKQATKKGKKTFTAADGNPKYMTKTKTKKDGTVKTKQKRYRKNIFKGQPGVRPL